MLYILMCILAPILMLFFKMTSNRDGHSYELNGKGMITVALCCVMFSFVYKINKGIDKIISNIHFQEKKKLFYLLIYLGLFGLFGFTYTFYDENNIYLIGYDTSFNFSLIITCVLVWYLSKIVFYFNINK